MKADLIGAFFALTALYVLARPRSAAAELIDAVTVGVIALVQRATDLGGSQ